MTATFDTPELTAVADAAARELTARAAGDEAEAALHAHQDLVTAASAALTKGCPLGAIAKAEQSGQEQARAALRGEALKAVERSGRRARDAQSDHEQAIVRAVRIGLSTREVAAAAGTSHGTVRAISIRGAQGADEGAGETG